MGSAGWRHGSRQNIQTAIARELKEEVNLTGDFIYRVVHVDNPSLLQHSKILQVRLVFIITPDIMEFSPGDDGDKVAFLSLEQLREIDEPKYDYVSMVLGKRLV